MKYKYLLFYLFMAIIFFGLSSSTSSDELFNQIYLKPLHNASAQYEKNSVIPVSKEEHIRQKIREYLISNHVNGSIAAVKNNKRFFSEGVGYSDIFNRTLNSQYTTFPIASITKTIVAVCILQLQESGKLTIQDPVSKYVSNLPKNIKIVHLLNHTSGIQPPIWHIGDKEPRDIIKKAAKRAGKFPAGTKWDYNDINYLVLGYIVEKVTGTTLHEYIEKNIFNKSSMVNAGFITPENIVPFTSKGYIKLAERLINSSKLNPYLLFGCGDIYATALDLCLFDEALMNGKLLKNQSLKEMVTPGPKSSYGLGVYHSGDRVYSRGVVGGWESLHVYFKDKTSIVVLLNVRDKERDIKKVAADIYGIINEKH
ncbi:serine hydrolase domain-containing protein [Neobacillus ginsengisoli]|uniref:CubicO group peptidase (Beta-lactamase class C family) n=1 Tax=Neobacillus ginsengisoli TaxID=904295 RepID=A0ABT9XTQ7_9BACI|nr:serine hydrolase domain-containing protein [Neobacillus ginsengisoli]MDQ0198935.1 CubicO group peptidase (beta-lactamase class C family) [Neobacillus ginsengisoli]